MELIRPVYRADQCELRFAPGRVIRGADRRIRKWIKVRKVVYVRC